MWIYPKALGRGSRPPLVPPAAAHSHLTWRGSHGLRTPSLSHRDGAASAGAQLRSHLGRGFALRAPARRLAGVTSLDICSLLPLDWEEQATTVPSTHPPWAAAFILQLDLLPKEVKHCKYILKTPRLVNAARNDYCLQVIKKKYALSET